MCLLVDAVVGAGYRFYQIIIYKAVKPATGYKAMLNLKRGSLVNS